MRTRETPNWIHRLACMSHATDQAVTDADASSTGVTVAAKKQLWAVI